MSDPELRRELPVRVAGSAGIVHTIKVVVRPDNISIPCVGEIDAWSARQLAEQLLKWADQADTLFDLWAQNEDKQ